MKIIKKDPDNKRITIELSTDESLVLFGMTYMCAKETKAPQVFDNLGEFNRELGAFLLEQDPEVMKEFQRLDQLWADSLLQ
jgi:hypothetical protein